MGIVRKCAVRVPTSSSPREKLSAQSLAVNIVITLGRCGGLDRLKRSPRCSAIAYQSLLGELKQEGFGRGDPALVPIFADRYHPPQHRLIGDFAMTVLRAAARIAGLPLAVPGGIWLLLEAIPEPLSAGLIDQKR